MVCTEINVFSSKVIEVGREAAFAADGWVGLSAVDALAGRAAGAELTINPTIAHKTNLA
jgi:hypothetical protein